MKVNNPPRKTGATTSPESHDHETRHCRGRASFSVLLSTELDETYSRDLLYGGLRAYDWQHAFPGA